MMWDLTGNATAQSRPRSPNPPFPIPTPGVPPEMSQSHPPYPTPFAPLGLPPAPASRQPSPNPLPSYNTFPRSVPPPLPGKSHTRGSSGPIPIPLPMSSKSVPQTQYSAKQHSQGHSTRTRHHSHSHSATTTRHVHYSNDKPQVHDVIPQRAATLPRTASSQQLKISVTVDQTKHLSGGHRVRVSSTGNIAQKPIVPPVTQSHQHVRLHNGRFEYSKCTGRKKALLIGINYTGQRRELRGCINDVKNVKRFLTNSWGYRDGDIVMLIDETNNPRQMPTRRNMIDAMKWLVKDAHPHDALFFHYSGHGGQVPDEDGDEIDGFDEVIYPVDYKRAGVIIDDDLHRIMVRPLPSGCRLTAIFDSCHSGTALDLPYIYHSNGRLKGSHISDSARAQKATPSDVISLAACKDDQTSADTVQSGVAVGAMSYAFVTSLTRKPSQSYQELLRSVREVLRQNYQQKPQLSSSHPVDTNLRFIL